MPRSAWTRAPLAAWGCAAVVSFGTVSHVAFWLLEIRCWLLDSLAQRRIRLSLPVFDYVSGSTICNGAVSSPSSFSASLPAIRRSFGDAPHRIDVFILRPG